MILSNKQPIKRLVVRNFKGQKLPEDYESSSWETLRLGISAILLGDEPPSCLEVLYKTCENMVRCNLGNSLYAKVYELIEQFNKVFAEEYRPNRLKCVLHIRRNTPKILPLKDAELLAETSTVWKVYCQRLRMAENVLMYLDRCYVLQKPEIKSIHELGMALFKHYFLESSHLFDQLKHTLLQSIQSIRLGKSLGDVSLQKSLVFLLVDTGLFEQFEPELLRDTSVQYQKDIVNDQFTSFKHVEIVAFWLIFEEQLAARLNYPRETQSKLTKIAEEMVLLRALEPMVASGLPALVEATWTQSDLGIAEPLMNDFGELQKSPGDSLFDLRLLVRLALRANGADVLKSHWSKFIKACGSSIIASSQPSELIEDILQFKARVESVLEQVFNKDTAMENAMKEAFETFINSWSGRLAELIAKYLDALLQNGKIGAVTERLSDEQIIEVIDRVIILFRFLQSKEAVESFYKQLLSKRLLQCRSLSIDLEREVVKRFKAECGASFTSRLEGMFKDIDSAPELNRLFREAVPLKRSGTVFNITVASSGIWPHPDDAGLRLPKEVSEVQEAFEKYYDGRHNGRRLVWNQNMGYCIVKAPFPQGTKELQVSIPQAVVLDCFNAAERLTFAELLTASKMDAESLTQTLDSLSAGKHTILLKDEAPSKSDAYTYNAAFTSRLVRIRLNTSAGREILGEQVAVAPVQLEDLQHRIDAAIVRTIKAARKMARAELASQVLGIMLQTPKTEIEKRIDLLITRDFISKDADDPAMVSYTP